MTTPKTTAERLADASIKIARANHYFVGFDPATTDGISYDDYTDAYQILITRENADKQTVKRQQFYDLAMGVLGSACYRQHHTRLI